MRTSWIRLALPLAMAAAGQLRAQQAEYARTAGDTIRYRNATKMEGVVRGAAGDAPFTLTRDATFAFAFAGGESVTAWLDAIAVEASGALGGERPSSDALVRALFRLHMTPNGRVVTVKAPEIPRSARLIAELPVQLDDFFPHLPANGTLKVGTTWTDTATRAESDSAGHHLSIRRINHYRASGDSLVGGRMAVVIVQHVDVRITSTVPMQTQPYIAALALTGDEDGTSLFSVSEGRLLFRERSGELHGAVTYKGGEEPWVVNQSYHYRRTDVLETVRP